MGKRHARVGYNPDSPGRRSEGLSEPQQVWLPKLLSPPSPNTETESPCVDEIIIPPPIEYQDQASLWGSSQPPSPVPLVIADDFPPVDDSPEFSSPEPPLFSPFSKTDPFGIHERHNRPIKSPRLDFVTVRKVELAPRSPVDYRQRPTLHYNGCYDLHDSGIESASSLSPRGKSPSPNVSPEVNFMLSPIGYQPEQLGFRGGGPLTTSHRQPNYNHGRVEMERMNSGSNDYNPYMQYYQHQPLNLINSRERHHAATDNYQKLPEISKRQDTSHHFMKSSNLFYDPRISPDSCEPENRKMGSVVDEEELILKNLVVLKSGVQQQSTRCSSSSSENKIDELAQQDEISVIKKFQCATCCKEFVDEKNLQLHYKIHLEPSDFHCHICDKFYHTKSGLQAHQRNMHQALNTNRLECPHCDDTFLTRFELIEHIGKHVNAFSRRCKKCASAFRTQSELKRHCILQHSDRPFGCSHCSHRSKTREKMDRHLQSHNLMNQYTCPHCNKKFAFKNSMNKHMTKRRCQVLKKQREVSSPKDLLRSAVEEAGFLNMMD